MALYTVEQVSALGKDEREELVFVSIAGVTGAKAVTVAEKVGGRKCANCSQIIIAQSYVRTRCPQCRDRGSAKLATVVSSPAQKYLQNARENRELEDAVALEKQLKLDELEAEGYTPPSEQVSYWEHVKGIVGYPVKRTYNAVKHVFIPSETNQAPLAQESTPPSLPSPVVSLGDRFFNVLELLKAPGSALSFAGHQAKPCHILFLGATGRGKTYAVRSVVQELHAVRNYDALYLLTKKQSFTNNKVLHDMIGTTKAGKKQVGILGSGEQLSCFSSFPFAGSGDLC
jgi:hypothetical protein